jgi:hypothetical protein
MQETSKFDEARLEAFANRAISDLTAGYTGVMVSLGSKLGLYRAMAGAVPLSANEVAMRAGCVERYVSEWLNARAAGGYIDYHAVSNTYELLPEQAMVLAEEDSPFLTRRRLWTHSAPAKVSRGASMTGGSPVARPPSTATATARTWCRNGCRFWKASSRSSMRE